MSCTVFPQFAVAMVTPNIPYYVSTSVRAYVSAVGAYGHCKGRDVFILPI